MTKVSDQTNANVDSVRHLASSSHKGVKSVSDCSSGVKVEAFSSIIDDRKALLDRVLGRWVCAV